MTRSGTFSGTLHIRIAATITNPNAPAPESKVQVWVPGVSDLTFDQPTADLPRGQVGFYSRSKAAEFDNLKVTATANAGFRIAVLPDTQVYTADSTGDFDRQTKWIARNRGPQKIAAVLHEGDIVGDEDCDYQWRNASNAMAYLDGKVPQAISTGNHDVLQYDHAAKGSCLALDTDPPAGSLGKFVGSGSFKDFFPANRYVALDTLSGANRQTYDDVGNYFDGSVDNSAQIIQAGGKTILLMSLTFGPSEKALEWANARVEEAEEDRTVNGVLDPNFLTIVVTHDFLADSGELRGRLENCVGSTPAFMDSSCDHALPGGASWMPDSPATGVGMWDDFVKGNSSIRLVLNGHVTQCAPQGTTCDHTAAHSYLSRPDGTWAMGILANYQAMPSKDANDNPLPLGYFRLIEFDPTGDRLVVSTVRAASDAVDSPLVSLPGADDNFEVGGFFTGDYTYSDVPRNHTFASSIYEVRERGIMTGYLDGSFQPGATISRQAAAVSLYRAITSPENAEGECTGGAAPFNDVPLTHRFCKAIRGMKDLGRIAGYNNGTQFLPNDPITRQALAGFMFGGQAPCPSGQTSGFADVGTSSDFCRAIKAGVTNEVFFTTAYPDGTFRPLNPLERQAAAVFLQRFDDYCAEQVTNCPTT